jgi:hypothetical protein
VHAAAVEVKGWHTERITPSYLREWPALFYFTRSEASAAVSALLGRDEFVASGPSAVPSAAQAQSYRPCRGPS